MNFEAKDGEDTFTVDFYSGKARFRCDLLDKDYATLEELERAVKQKRLTLRKNFSNPEAVLLGRWNSEAQLVTVTSVDDDKYVWVRKADGRRSKENRDSLYADMASVKAAREYEKQAKQDIADAWANVARWEPRP